MSLLRITKDHQRFRNIVKGKVRDDLRRFMGSRDLLEGMGGGVVSIPTRGINLPRFRYGDNSGGGVGMGESMPGDSVGSDEYGYGPGGLDPGTHPVEIGVDLSLDELADIMSEGLSLPPLKPTDRNEITTSSSDLRSIHQQGPEALKHWRRTLKHAMLRSIAAGTYDPDNPIITIERGDRRYRSLKPRFKPKSEATIIYAMDVSGSMGDEQKDMARLAGFWIDAWIARNYRGVTSKYIIHDVQASLVDRATFYRTRTDGGTKLSPAYDLINELLDTGLSNPHIFHFSDGDNSSETDSYNVAHLMKESILPRVNLFGYIQTASMYGSGNFWYVLDEICEGGDILKMPRINCREDIIDTMRVLFNGRHAERHR